jgi:hypothetical protein
MLQLLDPPVERTSEVLSMKLARTLLSLMLAGSAVVSTTSADAFVTSRRHMAFHHHRTGLVNLVGNRESGLGFYDLPPQFRNHPPVRDRRGDAIRYAVATSAGTNYYYGYCCGGFSEGHHHTVFNPVDGYGSPFFAGYYGPAGDPDEERGPFGNPY